MNEQEGQQFPVVSGSQSDWDLLLTLPKNCGKKINTRDAHMRQLFFFETLI